ncbi:MAG: ComF family protein, partial [Betaproteobacteria bacterium]|nr:ComF family protein [Betaproteobacteria bacterium]
MAAMPHSRSAYRNWSDKFVWPRLPLPGLCHACGQWSWQALCQVCTRLGDAPADVNALSCVAAKLYVSPWKELITAFKFEGQVGLAYFLAQQMRQTSAIAQCLDACDWLVPVPLSAQRLRDRGFNQALVLAKQLCPERTLGQALMRLRDTPAQSGLSRSDRLVNLHHAFMVNPHGLPKLRDSRVMLVDDVTTTGSTLLACTQALQAAGVKQVQAVVLAR